MFQQQEEDEIEYGHGLIVQLSLLLTMDTSWAYYCYSRGKYCQLLHQSLNEVRPDCFTRIFSAVLKR